LKAVVVRDQLIADAGPHPAILEQARRPGERTGDALPQMANRARSFNGKIELAAKGVGQPAVEPDLHRAVTASALLSAISPDAVRFSRGSVACEWAARGPASIAGGGPHADIRCSTDPMALRASALPGSVPAGADRPPMAQR
jgi:hypothetical protein